MYFHADTCIFGKDFLIVHDYNRPVCVSGYDLIDGARTFITLKVAVMGDHP